jgi:hypothetical protein
MRKRMSTRIALLTTALCLVCSPAWSQSDVAAAQVHLREAGQAYQDGNFDAFARSLETASKLNPFSLATRYNLACAYARTGEPEKALVLLQSLVDARVDYGMANDADLESLHGTTAFADLLGDLEKNLQPISVSSLEFTIEQFGVVPEGIAIDTQTGRTFVGSMRSGNIYVRNSAGQLSRFATVEHDGTLAAIGLYVDHRKQMLWAVGSSFDLNENFDPEAPVRAGVFGFDLANGRLQKKIIATDPGNGFNDLTIGPSGDMYISGSTVSVVRNGTDLIEPLKTSLPIVGSNGVVLSPDGNNLFVTSYPVGVAVVNLANGDTHWLAAPDDITLYGIDGLYWYDGDLVGVQNGVRPWRLVRIELDDAMREVTAVRLIEFANSTITPTTGAIVDDVIHYVGEGPALENIPSHFPAELARNSGKTIVMSAPLN